jgi:hypothetical protein
MDKDMNPDIFQYQKDFVAWLTELNEKSGLSSGMEKHIRSKYLSRLDTYQSSYLGRITVNLAETVFEPCVRLFGRDFVCRVLASHFKTYPPENSTLTSAADFLPEVLRVGIDHPEAMLFADVCEICIRRWKILTSIDPVHTSFDFNTEDLDTVYLKSEVELITPCAKHDLSGAWLLATQHESPESLPADLFKTISGVLLCKSSPTQFHVVDVPQQLIAFCLALVEKRSVASAIDQLENHLSASEPQTEKSASLTDISSKLQSLMAQMSSLNAFRQSPRIA